MTDTGNLEEFELNKRAHKFDDVNKSREAHHHTIGDGENQAASGKGLKDLVERVTTLEGVEIQTGSTSVVFAAQETTTVDVTFPEEFSDVPVVFAILAESSGVTLVNGAYNITTTGCTIRAIHKNTTSITVTQAVNWIAIKI